MTRVWKEGLLCGFKIAESAGSIWKERYDYALCNTPLCIDFMLKNSLTLIASNFKKNFSPSFLTRYGSKAVTDRGLD